MTTFEKSAQIIRDTIEANRGESGDRLALRILKALRDKRIVPRTMRASGAMFTRFHAHCRYLGNLTGSYKYWYNRAIRHAMRVDQWPVTIITHDVTVNGTTVTVDVPVPESTTKATNAQLLEAYTVIQDGAKDAGIVLPED
jgi:hypothetical protein